LGILLLAGCNNGHAPNPGTNTANGEDATPTTAHSPLTNHQSSELPLDKEQREFLFQIEHHGLVLGKHGFSRWSKALSQADASALRRLLAADFVGKILHEPREVRVVNDFAAITRQQDAGHPFDQVDSNQFVNRFMDYRKLFGKPPKVQLSLMALNPLKREKLDGLWEGTALLRMWGESTSGGPAEVILRVQYRVSRPTEANLADSGWLHDCAILQSQTAQSSRFLMREATAKHGINTDPLHDNWTFKNKYGITGGIYLCDFNRDGYLDLLITDVRRYALYQGTPSGKFVDVTQQVGLPTRPDHFSPLATLGAFVDLDGDGWEDLILGGRVYRNDSGQRFLDVTDQTNLRLPEDASGIAIADFDHDGQVDLYVTRIGKAKGDSWLVGKTADAKNNQLWRNLGQWRFEEVALQRGAAAANRSTFTAAWLDANNDGWPDLYVINEFGNGVLLINQGDGSFKEKELEGPGDFGSMGIACGDFDNDGRIDIYVANMYSKAGNRVIGNVKPGTYPDTVISKIRQFVAGSQLYHNRSGTDDKHPSSLTFEAVGKAMQVSDVGWSHGAVMVDLDNDGWLDLFSTAGYMSLSRDEPDG
jgi:hypothetical protein